jgi:hypothetical protein
MKKWLIVAGAALAVAAIPAAAGFAGNSALSRQVEVRTGQTASPTHNAGERAPSYHDDQGGLRPRGERTPEHGDDQGGLRRRDERTEKGDDRQTGSGRGRHGSGHGSDDGARHD